MILKTRRLCSFLGLLVEQLTSAWWAMVKHACVEAVHLGLTFAIHTSVGWATVGGPLITPEHSIQKVIWTETFIDAGKTFSGSLPQPETNEDYYRNIAVPAYPTPECSNVSTRTMVPTVTASKAGEDAQFQIILQYKEFISEESCWIQSEYKLRQMTVL